MIVHVAITRPHRWDEIHTLTHVSPAPCTTPTRVVAGRAVAWVPCGRRVPRTRQCRACRVHLIIESDQSMLDLDPARVEQGGDQS